MTDLDLCLSYLDEDLTTEATAEFERRLLAEPDLAAMLVEVARDEVIVRDWVAGRGAGTVPARVIGWLGRRGVVAALSAAALLLVAVLWMAWPAGQSDRRARLADARDVVWADGTRHDVGDTLRPGDRIAIESGTVELVYGNWAEVTLVGPGTFTVAPPSATGGEADVEADATEETVVVLPHGYLERGMITVHCPPGAEGFTVDGPGVRVVDLGTRFTLALDDEGRSRTDVHEGRVQLFRLDAGGAPQSRRTLFAHEVGRIDRRGIAVAVAPGFDAGNGTGGGALDVAVGRDIERTRDDFVADDYAFGPLQRFDETTGETTVRLPYGNRPALFGEVRGVLVDPDHTGGQFHSTDRNADATLEYHLRFDEPISAFRVRDALVEWDLGPNTEGGVEYSVDGVAWHPLRVIAGEHHALHQPFVDDLGADGLDTRELRLRYFTRAAENAAGPVGERWVKVYLTGGPGWGDTATSFFENHLELTVTVTND